MKIRLPTDIGMRLLALLLAVALWFVAAEEGNFRESGVEERVVPAAVRLEGVGSGLVLVNGVAPVEVRLRVPIGAGLPEQLEATADLSGRRTGDHRVPVIVNVPSRFAVVAIEPDKVSVRLEREISRAFPVEIAIVGLPVGQAVSAGDPVPDTVTLTGAESRVTRVDRVLAVAAYNSEDTVALATVRPVDKAGTDVPGLTIRPRQVKVAFAPAPEQVDEADSPDVPAGLAPGSAAPGGQATPPPTPKPVPAPKQPVPKNTTGAASAALPPA